MAESVKLMDSGVALFSSEGGMEGAVSKVSALLGKEGKVSRDAENFLTLDCSSRWWLRFIRVTIEKADVEGREDMFAASFKEASASTSLRHYSLLLAAVLILVALAFVMGSWWSLIPALLIIGGYLYLNYSPDKGNISRMHRIIKELSE